MSKGNDPQRDAGHVSEALLRHVPILVDALLKHQEKRVPLIADPAAKLEYHLFADAIYWSDELEGLPGELDDAFRVVLNHRTSLLAGEAGRFPEVWEAAQKYFPQWIGFRPERCAANADIAERIIRIRRVSARQMDRWSADGKNAEFPCE